nr:MAG TPA: hypothetical protein [Caudoviricetes sp.]
MTSTKNQRRLCQLAVQLECLTKKLLISSA